MGYHRTAAFGILRIAGRTLLFALAVWGGQATASDSRNGEQLMPIAAMDQAAHQGMDHASMPHPGGIAGMSDAHTHHHQMMQRQGYERSEHHYMAPDLALTDQQGRAIRLPELLDTAQPVMLNFIFTTCTTICPVLSATFSQIQSDLGERAGELRMISVTIDPEQDTPAVLQRYAERLGAGPQWRFLTGDIASIIEVQKAFDIYRGSKTNHQPITLLRGPGQSGWVRIEGIASASDVLAEYKKLQDQRP